MSNSSYINCSCCGHLYCLIDEDKCPFCSHDELDNDMLQAKLIHVSGIKTDKLGYKYQTGTFKVLNN